MRQDSVDEVDTTDLENWVFRPDFHLVDQLHQYEGINRPVDMEPRIVNMHDYEKTRKLIWKENRVDFARMYLNQGEPYTLRKYKRIYKREMTYRPHLYDVLDQAGNPKTKLKGINPEDPRFVPSKFEMPAFPKDFPAKLAEWKKLNNIQEPMDEDTWLKKQGFTDEQLSKFKSDQEEQLKAFNA
jgi:hypothetical protein